MRYEQTLNRWQFTMGAVKETVVLPHTWNVEESIMKHRGKAVYETTVFAEKEWEGKCAYITFQAVYHSARVFVNGLLVGSHTCSGFTPFQLEITQAVRFGEQNTITVEVDNTHTEQMLPHKDDFDWADDGGMIRRVKLEILEPDGIRNLRVTERITKMYHGCADGELVVETNVTKPCLVRVYEYATGRLVLEQEGLTVPFVGLKLWSCSTPQLYIVTLETENDLMEQRIGIRRIETRGEKVFLNGEEIFLKGCEWMPGSHPEFGMAEPLDHSIRCLRQLKSAGCVFTRFHWQQDDTIFDWCDENGLLVQEEIPYWGYPKQATELQLTIAQQQAEEMLRFHYHHPSIVCWGVGNELGGATRQTIDYVKNMVSFFKTRDCRRLVNYVSNSLSQVENEGKDDATLYGDIAMWNDYLGLWEPSTDIAAHRERTCKKAEGMPLLVSEFGLCEPHFPGGDTERARLLKEHLKAYDKIPNLCGYMWFSLNDYRTHCGEAGEDRLRRRVHGSTDLYGNPKPSYELLRRLQSRKGKERRNQGHGGQGQA